MSKALDVCLHEIDKRFITVKNSSSHYDIFRTVFDKVIEQMKAVDCNFKRYLSKIQYAGSFADGIKVKKLDEFDMNIVVKPPIDYDRLIIDPHKPGFVRLKLQDSNALRTDDRTMIKFDSELYLIHGPFRAWMEGVLTKALNQLQGEVIVIGQTYKLTLIKAGPALTVHCEGEHTRSQTSVDVDIVPVIEFPCSRLPAAYRKWNIHGDGSKDTWVVVPKPDKRISEEQRDRSWRVAFHVQESDILSGFDNLKPTIRLLKKLRDSLNMHSIASYFIKTLFLWEVIARKNQPAYWQQKQSVLFKEMLEKFHAALANKSIPFFWDSRLNLIGSVDGDLLEQYRDRLEKVLGYAEENLIVAVIDALLTREELEEFFYSDVYRAALKTGGQ